MKVSFLMGVLAIVLVLLAGVMGTYVGPLLMTSFYVAAIIALAVAFFCFLEGK